MHNLPRSRIIDHGSVKVRIDYNCPEESPERLAVQVAEQYQRKTNRHQDHAAFQVQIQAERQKATQLQFVIGQVRERQREDRRRAAQGLPPAVRSRMDPLDSYDVEACTVQIEAIKVSIARLQALADAADRDVRAAEARIVKLQAAIRNVLARAKQPPLAG